MNLQHRLRSLSTGLVGLRNVLHDQQLPPEVAAAAAAAAEQQQHFAAAGYVAAQNQLSPQPFDNSRAIMASAVHYQNQPTPVTNGQSGYPQGNLTVSKFTLPSWYQTESN